MHTAVVTIDKANIEQIKQRIRKAHERLESELQECTREQQAVMRAVEQRITEHKIAAARAHIIQSSRV